jgi:hypothetical protein
VLLICKESRGPGTPNTGVYGLLGIATKIRQIPWPTQKAVEDGRA